MDNFKDVRNFGDMYDSQNEEKEKKNDALDQKEDQIERIIVQLKSERKDLKKRLQRSYVNADEDSAGILMDLQVVEKRLNLNQDLKEKLFGES